MKRKVVIGCDNGCTGTISAFIDGKLVDFREQFFFKWRKPQVKNRNSYMSRLDFKKFDKWLKKFIKKDYEVIAVIERPMTDETRFHQTISSHHAQEALMIVLEMNDVPYMTVDSSEWQKVYLPEISGSKVLKLKSKEIGIEQFPKFSSTIEKHGDADAIFIGKLVVDYPKKWVSDDDRPFVRQKYSLKKIFSTNFKNGE